MVGQASVSWLPERLTALKRGGPSTITVTNSESLKAGVPLSVTRTVSVFVLGAGRPTVDHVNKPLVALMVAPFGAPEPRLYDNAWAGVSASVAFAVKLTICP